MFGKGKVHRFVGKKKRKQPEYDLHCQIAKYLTFALPPEAWFSTVENSNQRGDSTAKAQQGKLKRKGCKTGIPEIIVHYQSRSLWFEVKFGDNDLSDMQRYCHEEINAAGVPVVTVWSLEDVRQALLSHNIPCREVML